MTPESTKRAFDEIALIILGYAGARGDAPKEVRLSPEDTAKRVNDIGDWSLINHLYFMTEEGKRLIDQGRIEKAMRWLGFLQGALWGLGVTSIEEQKRINMPNEVPYDGKRI